MKHRDTLFYNDNFIVAISSLDLALIAFFKDMLKSYQPWLIEIDADTPMCWIAHYLQQRHELILEYIGKLEH